MAVTTAESSADGSTIGVPARPRGSDLAWVWQVTALSIVLGVMLALAVRTTRQGQATDEQVGRIQVSASLLARFKDENSGLEHQIVQLRNQVGQYVEEMKGSSSKTESLKRQFEDLKALAGLTRVQGPGLKITVQDSAEPKDRPGQPADYTAYLVHDQDLNALISELKEAGAQALAISGTDETNLQRIVVTTTARCVGPSAVVNGTYLAAPYHILATGDPKTLRSYLERPDGYIHGLRQLDVLKMVKIEDVERLDLPEYVGSRLRYAKPVGRSPGI